jgi:hypothetical protein
MPVIWAVWCSESAVERASPVCRIAINAMEAGRYIDSLTPITARQNRKTRGELLSPVPMVAMLQISRQLHRTAAFGNRSDMRPVTTELTE